MLIARSMLGGRNMLRELVGWWARQMRDLLPLSFLPTIDRADTLLVTVRPEELTLAIRRRGKETDIGRFAIEDAHVSTAIASLRRTPHRVVLRVPPETLLERPVELPLAAERDLQGVLGYEMNWLTPFAAADVIWQTVVLKRDRAQRRLLLRLTLVPRIALRPCLDLLSRLGLTADWLEADGGDGTLRRLPLTASGDRTGGRRIPILACAVGVLAAAVVITPFVTQSLARNATERAITALASNVAKAEALRKRLVEGAAGAGALAQEQARTGDVLQMLAAVTQIVPNDTWLSDLSVRQGKLSFSGQSPAAAQLIPALAADPSFHNPAFAAPVIRAPDGHAEQFVIRADLAP